MGYRWMGVKKLTDTLRINEDAVSLAIYRIMKGLGRTNKTQD
jgi:hypothetical protein